MIKRIRKMRGSLAFRLLYVVCSTFLPLNIMAIAVSGIVILKSREQILSSYQRELNTAMSRLEIDLQKLDDHMDEFVLEYLVELTLPKTNVNNQSLKDNNFNISSDNMVSYEMINNLGKAFLTTDISGILYLYDCIEDKMFVKYDKNTYDILEIEEIKKQMLEEEFSKTVNDTLKIFQFKDRFLYLMHYEYTNYQIGFFTDLGENLGVMLNGLMTKGKIVYFTDGEKIVKINDNEIIEELSWQWEDIFRDKLSYQFIKWSSRELGCSIGIKIPIGISLESIPILNWILMILAFLFGLLVFGLWRIIQKRVIKPLATLQDAMKHLEEKNLSYRIENKDDEETDDFNYIYTAFNHMAEEIKLSHDKDIMMFQTQLDNLLLQVNPHMLLNSFNMIYSLAQTKNYECIQEFSIYLVDYFRYALKETDVLVPLEKEIKFVKSYIGIQKIRFPGSFTSVHNISPEAEKALIPPLIIENFVENAMKYALIPGQTIEILINIRKEEERLLISICDTGRGINEDIMEHIKKGEMYVDEVNQKHIGILNCRRRLELFYGNSASMNITSRRGEGTQVFLEIPFVEQGVRVRDETINRR